MTGAVLRRWFWIHTWTSLVCTVFLLVVCLTGLPLVLRAEITDLFAGAPPLAAASAATPRPSLDRFADASRRMFPKEVIAAMAFGDDAPTVSVVMAPSWQALRSHPASAHTVRFDARTLQVLPPSSPSASRLFLGVMLEMHKDLFAGPFGRWLMAAMALAFVAAVSSGVVVYAPFMRKRAFGDIRASRSSRLKWLDLHNLAGIVLAAWMAVVGATGASNELAKPLSDRWQQAALEASGAAAPAASVPAPSETVPVQAAVDAARAALPDLSVTGIAFPGSPAGSPGHYLVRGRGRDQLHAHLVTAMLIDARTGMASSILSPPWWLRILALSRPLHFGDYGGLPLKIIWILSDLLTIGVLASGLYLWLARGASSATRDAARAGRPRGFAPDAAE